MGRALCTQKGSCRDKLERHVLSSDSLLCSVCKEHARFSDRSLRIMVKNNRIVVDNVCEDVLGTLSPETRSAREAFLSVTSRKRQRTPKTVFIPGESPRIYKTKKKTQCKINLSVPLEISEYCIVKEVVPHSKKIKCRISYTIEEQPGIKSFTELTDLFPVSLFTNTVSVQQKEVPVPHENTTIPTVTGNCSDSDSLSDGCSMSGSDSDEDDPMVLCQETRMNQNMKSLKEAMGSDLLSRIKEMSVHERRSVLSSFCLNHSKETIQCVLGIIISATEWGKIRIHQRYPGPHKPVIKPKIYRQRISSLHLHRLLTFLHQPGYLQRVAFGTKVEKVMDGDDYKRLDNVARLVKLSKITSDFLMTIDQEAVFEGSLPSSEIRCQCLEKGTFRRCLRLRNHQVEGSYQRCKYTEKGSLSTRTVEEFVKTLTSGQIKSLSGLDDVKELKGRKSFESLRLLANKYCMVNNASARLIHQIDQTEIYYQTDYAAHLSRDSDYECACLTCGYSVSEVFCLY